MVTSMFFSWELNCSTIRRMKGPSPPVKPFQNDRFTFGPLYSLPLPAPACCCTAGFSSGPPPQPVSTKPAPAPALMSRNSWRVTLRPINRPLSVCLLFPLLGGFVPSDSRILTERRTSLPGRRLPQIRPSFREKLRGVAVGDDGGLLDGVSCV